jgi:MFS transporter, DHA1 family, inner membrane transport protein
MKSRPTVLSSSVLALALLGDSLLYAVLPLHAATFGVSLAWVGVLLSVNRIARLFVYRLLARAAGFAGLRRFTIAAATLGGASTLTFAVASGGWPLFAARVAWGIAFGSLSLATLAYATASPDGAGTRVGLSLALRELGPIASLTAGMVLVTLQGVRPTLAILGATSMLAIPLAMLLPDHDVGLTRSARAPQPRRRPTRHEGLSAAVGLVADGIFPATIALLLVPTAGVRGAAIAAGTLLAAKRAAVVVLSPIRGRAADRFGARATTVTGIALIAAGAFLIACSSIVAGSILLICGAAVTSTSIPLAATAPHIRERLPLLARLGTARDAGAAAGPLVAMALF